MNLKGLKTVDSHLRTYKSQNSALKLNYSNEFFPIHSFS